MNHRDCHTWQIDPNAPLVTEIFKAVVHYIQKCGQIPGHIVINNQANIDLLDWPDRYLDEVQNYIGGIEGLSPDERIAAKKTVIPSLRRTLKNGIDLVLSSDVPPNQIKLYLLDQLEE